MKIVAVGGDGTVNEAIADAIRIMWTREKPEGQSVTR